MSSGYKLSTGRLAQKVDWEGGVLEAIQYGVKAAEIEDPAIARRWKRLEQLWLKMEPDLVTLARTLRTAQEERAA
jgi:hypothetical protein